MTPGDWSDMLAGGAGGSNRTKRCRYESMEKPETGLAAGLLSYREKWDASNCEPNPKKKPKGSASAKKDESQLAQNLLSVLQKCLENGDSDKAVAQTLKHSFGAWTRQAAKESHKAQPTDQEKGTRVVFAKFRLRQTLSLRKNQIASGLRKPRLTGLLVSLRSLLEISRPFLTLKQHLGSSLDLSISNQGQSMGSCSLNGPSPFN